MLTGGREGHSMAVKPSHAERSRSLLVGTSTGFLSTLSVHTPGYPFGSLVSHAATPEGDPLFLLSRLAEHTTNFQADPRLSLMVTEDRAGDPLEAARLTLLGQIQEDDQGRDIYLERHPQAKLYASFKDFAFYRLKVQDCRYVGGFGEMSWVSLEAYRSAEPDPLIASARGIIDHMNEDHQDAMQLILVHQKDHQSEQVEMVAVDRYGYTLRVPGPPPVTFRLDFPEPVSSPEKVRKYLVAQVHQAREALT